MTDLTMILDRIADRTATTADVDLLRRHPRVHGNRNVVQIGRSNINVREAGDIVVDNRAYYGHQADEIRAALATAFADPVGPGELYPGLPDTQLVTECPTMATRDGSLPLRDWLRHYAGAEAWPRVVSQFYARAAADPEIADYFRHVDLAQLQRHFLAAMMIVTGQGVTVGLVRSIRTAHSGVRDSEGDPIDACTWDAVIGVLADVLTEHGVPGSAIAALATTIAPLRAAIVVGA
jgi:truncated hemoglobin YjbI